MVANSCSYQHKFKVHDEKTDEIKTATATTAGQIRVHYIITIHFDPLIWKIRLNTMATAAADVIAKILVADSVLIEDVADVSSLVIKKHSS